MSEMLGKGGRTVNRWAWFQNTHRRSGFISVQTNSIVTQRPVIDEFEKAEEGSLKTKATRKTHGWGREEDSPSSCRAVSRDQWDGPW